MEQLFLNLINKTKQVIEKDIVWFYYDNKKVIQQDLENNSIWFDATFCWNQFNKQDPTNDYEVQQLFKKLLVKHYYITNKPYPHIHGTLYWEAGFK